ncbi:ABC transporter ATP-binding protein [Candidatus Sumerlaeota bacterium]|nr:ABC transporter ATP-binding protein [Candidatus Sumerlaeota bacterium]
MSDPPCFSRSLDSRLVQRIIDQGIAKHNQTVVVHTGLLMLGISLLSATIAVGNNIFSVRVGESVARDIRDALFLKIQTFSFSNLDRLKSGELMARLIKAFVRSDLENKNFQTANDSFTEYSIRVMRFVAAMSPALTMCVNIGMVAEVLDTAPDVQDQKDAVTLPETSPGRILMKDVSFRYDKHGSESVLEDINLVVKPGQTVAILGATGSGKSSLVNLVPRFYDVSKGSVSIDGVDVHKVRQDSLLEQIAMVPQETTLFSGSVRDNIRYGAPDASEEDVIEAARNFLKERVFIIICI